jgi:thioredoxin reductase
MMDVFDLTIVGGEPTGLYAADYSGLRQMRTKITRNDVKVNSRMEKNIPGIYAAGDIVTYPGNLKLIATGFAEAAIAVNAAKAFIDPKAKFCPGYSTDSAPLPRKHP